jgi:hypothetical protein
MSSVAAAQSSHSHTSHTLGLVLTHSLMAMILLLIHTHTHQSDSIPQYLYLTDFVTLITSILISESDLNQFTYSVQGFLQLGQLAS